MNTAAITALFLVSTSAIASDLHEIELKAIAMNESLDGKYLNHRKIEKGLHKGTQAGGWHGLMPLTTKDLVAGSAKLRKKYGFVLDMSNAELTRLLNQDRKMEKEIALHFWKSLRKQFSPRRSAYAWLYGPGKADKAPLDVIVSNEYVQRFYRNLRKTLPYEST